MKDRGSHTKLQFLQQELYTKLKSAGNIHEQLMTLFDKSSPEFNDEWIAKLLFLWTRVAVTFQPTSTREGTILLRTVSLRAVYLKAVLIVMNVTCLNRRNYQLGTKLSRCLTKICELSYQWFEFVTDQSSLNQLDILNPKLRVRYQLRYNCARKLSSVTRECGYQW